MNRSNRRNYNGKILALTLFAVAMAYLEAAVVVYLRELYYPGGFTLTMPGMTEAMLTVEMLREAATLVLLIAVAFVAGRLSWERFGYLIFVWGVWDIFYYVWLKIAIDWPATLFDWDVLFLLPLPWLGPIIAPILVAILMVIFGFLITRLQAAGVRFRATGVTWALAIIATGMILYTFMRDYGALATGLAPKDFLYSVFLIGWLFYIAAFILSYYKIRRQRGVSIW